MKASLHKHKEPTVSVRIRQSLIAAARDIAEREDRTITSVIERALKAAFIPARRKEA